MMTPKREQQIRKQTPPRDHIDCGERATAIWDLLDEVERLRALANERLAALEAVLPYAESRVEDIVDIVTAGGRDDDGTADKAKRAIAKARGAL